MNRPGFDDSGAAPHADAVPPSIAGAIMMLSVGYNAILAWVNAHIFELGRSSAAALDAMLILTALFVAFVRWRPDMTRWLMMIGCFGLLLTLLSIGRGELSPKDFRDVALIATFIMLGMTVSRAGAVQSFLALHALIFVVMVFELALPESYAALLDPAGYFVNTRGFTEEQFYGADLFNAVRPDDRYFLPQLGLLRASSIFLEPVTFGNYCAFAMLMMIAFWGDMGWRLRISLALSWIAILIGCDSRFAAATSLLLLAAAPLIRRVPTYAATLFLPAALALVAVLVAVLGFSPLEDTFAGRLARGLRHLGRLDAASLAGLDLASARQADAGVAYLVTEQSLLGVALLLGFLFLQPKLRDSWQRLVVNGAALILTLSLLVSNSILSLKSGAPLWFLVGVAIAARERNGDKGTSRSRSAEVEQTDLATA